jgi:DNA helicase-2/ATP-dependent DNA helicase PcrA
MLSSTAKTDSTFSHPEFIIEKNHLQNIIQELETFLNNEEKALVNPDSAWSNYGGADEWTGSILYSRALSKINVHRKSLDYPYFGRIDLSNNGNTPETFYIGKLGFDVNGINIIDWRSPIAQLFYKSINPMSNYVSYYTPDGFINSNLLLKRRLKIDSQILREIYDELDWRNGKPSENTLQCDTYLEHKLTNRDTTSMEDIIETIQEHQYDLIRCDPNTILVINGVAGSGKTSIAYHRLAYLIYPGMNTGIIPQRTIVFTPNRMFIGYVRNLLPTLNLNSIQQETFDDWAMYRMNLIDVKTKDIIKRKYILVDSSLQAFLSKNTSKLEKIYCWKRSKLKGSLKFKKVIDAYIKYRKSNFQFTCEKWEFTNIGKFNISLSYTLDEIRDAINSANSQNICYKDFIYRIFKNLMQKYNREDLKAVEAKNHQISIIRIFNKPKDEVESRKGLFEKRLHEELDNLFKPITLRDYYEFLQNRELLEIICNDILSSEEISLLSKTHQIGNEYDIEDIPGLFYLYLLVNGKSDETYDHIIVDEAQDFSPFQFYILKQFLKNKSMTILGDIAQGIFAYRGINNWIEIEPILSHDNNYVYREVSISYRATRQIVEFTNQVKNQIGKGKYLLSEPFSRTGEKPKIIRTINSEQMYIRISNDIAQLIKKGIQNIGIIIKDPEDCLRVAAKINRISENKVSYISAGDNEKEYLGGVIVMPVILVKGIEFEAVLIVNADEQTYDSEIAYDGRLFYVAITRALHFLEILFVGEPTGFLQNAFEFADYSEIT